jgi:hypothetical protein
MPEIKIDENAVVTFILPPALSQHDLPIEIDTRVQQVRRMTSCADETPRTLNSCSY